MSTQSQTELAGKNDLEACGIACGEGRPSEVDLARILYHVRLARPSTIEWQRAVPTDDEVALVRRRQEATHRLERIHLRRQAREVRAAVQVRAANLRQVVSAALDRAVASARAAVQPPARAIDAVDELESALTREVRTADARALAAGANDIDDQILEALICARRGALEVACAAASVPGAALADVLDAAAGAIGRLAAERPELVLAAGEANAKAIEREVVWQDRAARFDPRRPPDYLAHAEGAFWLHDGRGLWARLSDEEIRREAMEFNGYSYLVGAGDRVREERFRMSGSAVHQVVSLLRTAAAEPEFFAAAQPGILFRTAEPAVLTAGARRAPGTGFLCVTPDGEARLLDPSPDRRARHAYKFPLDLRAPDKLAPRFQRFLFETFRDHADPAAVIRVVLGYAGAALLGHATKFQRALILVGEGATGKSTLVKILEACFPPGTVESLQLRDISGQKGEYYRARLAGKLLNLTAELDPETLSSSDDLKALISGDLVSGRDPAGRPFTFKSRAGTIAATNRLFGTTDNSEAFWRRFVPVPFNNVKPEEERDPHLADRIIAEERPEIVTLLIDLGIQLLRHGRIELPAESKAKLIEWRHDVDPLLDWWAEGVWVPDPNATAPAQQVYGHYSTFVGCLGHRPLAASRFGARLAQLGIKVDRRHGRRFYRLKKETPPTVN